MMRSDTRGCTFFCRIPSCRMFTFPIVDPERHQRPMMPPFQIGESERACLAFTLSIVVLAPLPLNYGTSEYLL